MTHRTDIIDLIEVLLELREPRPHERLIALATFCAWLYWPAGPRMVEDARAVAGALVVRGLLQGKVQPVGTVSEDVDVLMNLYLSPSVVADVLLDRAYKQEPFFIEYAAIEEEHKLACATAEYLVRAPRLPRPSLNRCRFFIAKGGFAPPFTKTEICPPRAVSTSKKAWFHYGAVSPFLLAARISKLPLVDLAPDDDGALAKLARLSEVRLMTSYFQSANAIQTQLIASLDLLAERRLEFVNFPRGVESADPSLSELSPQQQKLSRTYSVANATKIRIR
ncbi:hypothetical protein RPMA_07095 [Tardiphaga alba]|uniref:Nucleotidyltransferase family protein n=1 Tax=Tardiphaga alba TaxID=340268 RepID=A0ABX8A4M8_9BRAD|nr:hypothetical protein [Tardiphaga alba]QUS38626.1 hypothetical protein RPMA_07095 [Tardiphaga alba]